MTHRGIGRGLATFAFAGTVAGCGEAATSITSHAPSTAPSIASGPVWKPVVISDRPLPRNSAGFAYDPTTKNIVLTGGRHGCGASAAAYTDTWILDGSAWHLQAAGPNPGDMASFSMAYDAGSSQLIALGVYSGCGVATGMMTWNGSTWTSPSSGMTLPSPMFHRSMAFDAATNQLIVFGYAVPANGAQPSSSNTGSQTWAYDGTSWKQLQPATSPPGMIDTAMAYDAITRQVVLFGGEPYDIQSGGGSPVNDTWAFDGITWSKLQTSSAPPPRDGAAMVFDDAMGEVVLLGGASSDPDAGNANPNVFDDMWTFAGGGWTQLHPSTMPSGRFDTQMTYNPVTQQIVLFGGALNTSSDANDTWTFGTS